MVLSKKIEKYEPKDFSYLLSGIGKLSEDAMKLHYKLYEGYINKTNEINQLLKMCDIENANHNYSNLRSLLIDSAHNLNGVVLHELFFSNLTDEKTEPDENFIEMIRRDFLSWENYIKNIKATAKSSRCGWAITGFNKRNGAISNFAIDQHDLHVPVNVVPLVVIDLWEHSFTKDFGIDKAGYIDEIMNNIDWAVVYNRFCNINA